MGDVADSAFKATDDAWGERAVGEGAQAGVLVAVEVVEAAAAELEYLDELVALLR